MKLRVLERQLRKSTDKGLDEVFKEPRVVYHVAGKKLF